MSATEATAEIFVTAFKSLKPRQREAVLERMLQDEDISADIADTLTLESRRHQPRQPFRQVMKELGIKA
jgi:DNA-directed RNA polymerase specialized sigma24 family protein